MCTNIDAEAHTVDTLYILHNVSHVVFICRMVAHRMYLMVSSRDELDVLERWWVNLCTAIRSHHHTRLSRPSLTLPAVLQFHIDLVNFHIARQ